MGRTSDAGAGLCAAGADVRPDPRAKAVVIAGRFAYIGAMDLSWSSISRTIEIDLIPADRDAVARIAATIDAAFAAGRTEF